jgi:hypothetical protein
MVDDTSGLMMITREVAKDDVAGKTNRMTLSQWWQHSYIFACVAA